MLCISLFLCVVIIIVDIVVVVVVVDVVVVIVVVLVSRKVGIMDEADLQELKVIFIRFNNFRDFFFPLI